VAANYELSYVDGNLTVTKAPLTITAPDLSRPMGADNPPIVPTFDGFQNGEGPGVLTEAPTCATNVVVNTPPGTYEDLVYCQGAAATNYAITYVRGTITVTKAPLTVTAPDATMTYGGAAVHPFPVYTGFVPGRAFLETNATCTGGSPTTPAGLHVDGTSCSGVVSSWYDITYVPGDLTVAKAPLVVTASNATKTYGAATAAVTPSYAGFVNGQGAAVLPTAPTCGGGGLPSTPAGTHAAATSCSGAVSNNYEISYVNGTLTVIQAPVVVTASSATKTYGGAAPVITPSYVGFVLGETAAVLTMTPTCQGGTATTPAGTHATTCSGAAAANYSFSSVNGTLTVAQAPLTVTADGKTRAYGSANPPLTFTATGFVNGEGVSVLTGAPTLATTATTSSNVGSYPITIAKGTLASGNYAFTFVGGSLAVTRATTTLVAAPAVIKLSTVTLTLGKVSARLTYGPGGTPAVGQTVVFSAGTTALCTAVTGAGGTATCTLALVGQLATVANLGYSATFTGTPNLAPTTARGDLITI
jgi:hypothetical protein